MLNVLHITSWYPNKKNKHEGIWIKNHIDSLDPYVDQHIIYLNINYPKQWFIKEIIILLVLSFHLVKNKVNHNYGLINFHIAYPNLTYWHLIKRFVKIPVVITEHWSAYHFNFGVKKSLPRIQRIFKQNIPVITVSKALTDDIIKFSNSSFSNVIIPNVVNNKIFFPEKNKSLRKPFFFMVSQWKTPKNPFIAMKSFLDFNKKNASFKLIIGGYGPLIEKMKIWILDNQASGIIELVGTLNSQEIANYFRTCTAFLHPTDYETFSVVCAEAISCETQVIASNVGGIPEVLEQNGILIKEGSEKKWINALKLAKKHNIKANNYSNKFSSEHIGKKYYSFLKKIKHDYKQK